MIHDKIGIVHGCITTAHNLTNTQTLLDCPINKKNDLRRGRSGFMNMAREYPHRATRAPPAARVKAAPCPGGQKIHQRHRNTTILLPFQSQALPSPTTLNSTTTFQNQSLRQSPVRSYRPLQAPTSTGSATAIALIFPELKGKLNGLAIRVPLTNSSITDCVFEVKRATTVEEVNALLRAAAEAGPLKDILGFETEQLVSTDYVNDPRSGIVDADCTQARGARGARGAGSLLRSAPRGFVPSSFLPTCMHACTLMHARALSCMRACVLYTHVCMHACVFCR